MKLNVLHHTGIVAKNLSTSITSGYYYKYQNDIHLARVCSIYTAVIVVVVFVCELDYCFTTMASVDDAKTEGEKRIIVIAMDGSVHAKYALICKYMYSISNACFINMYLHNEYKYKKNVFKYIVFAYKNVRF